MGDTVTSSRNVTHLTNAFKDRKTETTSWKTRVIKKKETLMPKDENLQIEIKDNKRPFSCITQML